MAKKAKRPWLKDPELRRSIADKERQIFAFGPEMIRANVLKRKFPFLTQAGLKRRTAIALGAMHKFKPMAMRWGHGKKHGPVELRFEPVFGYKSVSTVESGFSEVRSYTQDFQADHMFGLENWLGFAARFMAYPGEAELRKCTDPRLGKTDRAAFQKLRSLEFVSWPEDYITAARGSLGYVGGTVTFAGNEHKPTFFIQPIEIRGEYYRLPKVLRRRYEGWQTHWIREIEMQCRRAGFKRVAIMPSTDPYFSNRYVKIKPKTREALYKKLPERMGYRLETLQVPTENGMKEVRYYMKKLG